MNRIPRVSSSLWWVYINWVATLGVLPVPTWMFPPAHEIQNGWKESSERILSMWARRIWLDPLEIQDLWFPSPPRTISNDCSVMRSSCDKMIWTLRDAENKKKKKRTSKCSYKLHRKRWKKSNHNMTLFNIKSKIITQIHNWEVMRKDTKTHSIPETKESTQMENLLKH